MFILENYLLYQIFLKLSNQATKISLYRFLIINQYIFNLNYLFNYSYVY
jgi:hypothetical protein